MGKAADKPVAELLMAIEPLKPGRAQRISGWPLVAELLMAIEPLKRVHSSTALSGPGVAELLMAIEPLKHADCLLVSIWGRQLQNY